MTIFNNGELNRAGIKHRANTDQSSDHISQGKSSITLGADFVPGNVNTGLVNNKSLLTLFLPDHLRQTRTIIYQSSQ